LLLPWPERMTRDPVESRRSVGLAVEEGIQQRGRFGLGAGHQVAVEVEGDLDRGVAHLSEPEAPTGIEPV
jgi:hypothetical protein